jgi:hypothetical protein
VIFLSVRVSERTQYRNIFSRKHRNKKYSGPDLNIQMCACVKRDKAGTNPSLMDRGARHLLDYGDDPSGQHSWSSCSVRVQAWGLGSLRNWTEFWVWAVIRSRPFKIQKQSGSFSHAKATVPWLFTVEKELRCCPNDKKLERVRMGFFTTNSFSIWGSLGWLYWREIVWTYDSGLLTGCVIEAPESKKMEDYTSPVVSAAWAALRKFHSNRSLRYLYCIGCRYFCPCSFFKLGNRQS